MRSSLVAVKKKIMDETSITESEKWFSVFSYMWRKFAFPDSSPRIQTIHVTKIVRKQKQREEGDKFQCFLLSYLALLVSASKRHRMSL